MRDTQDLCGSSDRFPSLSDYILDVSFDHQIRYAGIVFFTLMSKELGRSFLVESLGFHTEHLSFLACFLLKNTIICFS